MDFFNHQAHSFVDTRRITTSVTGDFVAKWERAEEGGLGREIERWPAGRSLSGQVCEESTSNYKSEDTVTLFRQDLLCVKWATTTEKRKLSGGVFRWSTTVASGKVDDFSSIS
jgi:hypothetical protein